MAMTETEIKRAAMALFGDMPKEYRAGLGRLMAASPSAVSQWLNGKRALTGLRERTLRDALARAGADIDAAPASIEDLLA